MSQSFRQFRIEGSKGWTVRNGRRGAAIEQRLTGPNAAPALRLRAGVAPMKSQRTK